jgi:hypothetical protein
VLAAGANAVESTKSNDEFKTMLAASARKELANFASNILAATVCKEARFNSDGVVPLMIGVKMALSKEDTDYLLRSYAQKPSRNPRPWRKLVVRGNP